MCSKHNIHSMQYGEDDTKNSKNPLYYIVSIILDTVTCVRIRERAHVAHVFWPDYMPAAPVERRSNATHYKAPDTITTTLPSTGMQTLQLSLEILLYTCARTLHHRTSHGVLRSGGWAQLMASIKIFISCSHHILDVQFLPFTCAGGRARRMLTQRKTWYHDHRIETVTNIRASVYFSTIYCRYSHAWMERMLRMSSHMRGEWVTIGRAKCSHTTMWWTNTHSRTRKPETLCWISSPPVEPTWTAVCVCVFCWIYIVWLSRVLYRT